MASALATQLAQGASLNTTLLSASRQRGRAPTESYLFTSREADRHDLEAIHALGVNGLTQLRSLDKRFGKFEEYLFADNMKSYDRTLHTKEDNRKLDGRIEEFLPLLGPWLLEAPAGKVIEWLVRRFRINEFNVDALLALFLPYHESPHFAKLLSILHLEPQSAHAYLAPTKASAKPLSPQTLVTALTKSPEVLRFVCGLLPAALENGTAHRTLVAFTAATLLAYFKEISQQGGKRVLDEGALAILVPALIAPLKAASTPNDAKSLSAAVLKDAILSAYLELGALSRSCALSPSATGVILAAMAGSCSSSALAPRFIRAAIAFVASQETADSWSKKTASAVLNVPDFAASLQDALELSGMESLLLPLLPAIFADESDVNTQIVETIVSSDFTPTTVLRRVTVMLLQRVALGTDQGGAQSRRYVRMLQQRRPEIFQKAHEAVAANADAETKAKFDALILSLATGATDAHGGATSITNYVTASVSADTGARRVAVEGMFGLLADADKEEKEALSSALFARLQDSDEGVLQSLYGKSSDFVPVVRANWEQYISALSSQLSEASTFSRGALRLHLEFLCKYATQGSPAEQAQDVFEKVIFPLLLVSKPRLKTAWIAWNALSSDNVFTQLPIVKGGVETWKKLWPGGGEVKAKSTEEEDKLIASNVAIAARMGELVAASNDFDRHFSFLIAQLSSPHAHARGLAFLILRTVLSRLNDVRRLSAGLRVLSTITTWNVDVGDYDELQNLLEDEALVARVLYDKPRSARTQARANAAFVLMLARTPCPIEATPFLFSPGDSSHIGAAYARFGREVYARVAVVGGSLPVVVHRTIFAVLGPNALAFLAGLWANPPSMSDFNMAVVQHAALAHGIAFLAAHLQLAQPPDFQVILPSILGVLQSANKQIREAAAECLLLLAKLSNASGASKVYGLDTIYGAASNELTFIEWVDLGRYLKALIEQRDYFVAEGGSVPTQAFHAGYLRKAKSDSKRDATQKLHVLAYLASHASYCPLIALRVKLLATVSDVSSVQKTLMLSHAITPVIAKPFEDISTSLGKLTEEYATLLVGSFDGSIATSVNEVGSNLWEVVLSTVRWCYNSSVPAGIYSTLARKVEQALYPSLEDYRKLELVQVLLSLSTQDTETYARCKKTLSAVLFEAPNIIQLLITLRSLGVPSSPRASKRARVDQSTTPEQSASENLARLVLLAEVLSVQALPASIELASCLLETINVLLHTESTEVDLAYVQQLLMSAVEMTTAKMQPADIKPGSLRLEVLVELTRATSEPQTFNQALLLMATLSRLVPEAVLHHIMPVFTFMGSNVLHRDDAYSFRVVEQTIDNTVPIMVNSLKGSYSDRLALYIAARDFLRIFSDAANHIPRHRRTNFFLHLVNALGPAEFLAPLCMLLVNKVAPRIVKQENEDVQATLILPTTMLHRQSPALQMQVLSEFLEEAQRLTSSVIAPADTPTVFLADVSEDEHSVTSPSVTIRRAQALVIFVANALRHSAPGLLSSNETGPSTIELLLSKLLSLAVVRTDSMFAKELANVSFASQAALRSLLRTTTAGMFVRSVVFILGSDEESLQIGAMDLLNERLPLVSDEARTVMASDIVLVIQKASSIISSHSSSSIITSSALRAMRVIGETMRPGEESALTATIPVFVEAVRLRREVNTVLAALRPIPAKLGPRLIPYFRDLIQETITILRESQSRTKDQVSYSVEDAVGLLSGLLASIPTFWGKTEIWQVLKLYVDSQTDYLHSSLSTLMKAVAKRLPPKTLLPTLCEAWTELQIAGSRDDVHRFSAFFQVVRRCLRAASRFDALDQLRPLFKIFTEAFGRRADLENPDSDEGEDNAILAFVDLTVKLNDTAFRPLFRKVFDWAFVTRDSGDVYRQITFCRVYIALLDYFKNLMTPYMSFLLQPFVEALKSSSSNNDAERVLWANMLTVTSKSFNYDEGEYWRDDKLRQIATPLVEQVPACAKMNTVDAKAILTDCLVGLGETATDDTLLKSLNINVLMHTRSDDTRIRILALQCAEALWKAHAGKLLGFVAETATFIFECAEDENDSVVQAAIKVKNAVESVAGNISGL